MGHLALIENIFLDEKDHKVECSGNISMSKNTNNNNKNKKRTKRNTNRQHPLVARFGLQGTTFITRAPNYGLANHAVVYNQTEWTIGLVNATNASCNTYLYANAIGSAMDVAGAPATSAIVTNQAFWRTLYVRYRVVRSKFTIRFVNADTFAHRFMAGYSNTIITKNNSSYYTYAQGSTFKDILVGPAAQNTVPMTVSFPWVDHAKFIGSVSETIDDTYSGLASTPGIPGDGVFFNFGMRTMGGGAMTSGLTVLLRCEQEILFTELVPQTS